MEAPIVICTPDPAWPSAYARMRAAVRAAAGGHVERIEHIGSTAVPGLAAKPIIDVMVGVADDALIDVAAEPEVEVGGEADIEPAGPASHVDLVQALQRIGFVYRSINGIPGRLFFRRRDVVPGQHIHLVRTGSAFWVRHLLFRDYLRAHPDEVTAYAALKRRLAAVHGSDRMAYTEAKSDFITACEARAHRWRHDA